MFQLPEYILYGNETIGKTFEKYARTYIMQILHKNYYFNEDIKTFEKRICKLKPKKFVLNDDLFDNLDKIITQLNDLKKTDNYEDLENIFNKEFEFDLCIKDVKFKFFENLQKSGISYILNHENIKEDDDVDCLFEITDNLNNFYANKKDQILKYLSLLRVLSYSSQELNNFCKFSTKNKKVLVIVSDGKMELFKNMINAINKEKLKNQNNAQNRKKKIENVNEFYSELCQCNVPIVFLFIPKYYSKAFIDRYYQYSNLQTKILINKIQNLEEDNNQLKIKNEDQAKEINQLKNEINELKLSFNQLLSEIKNNK